MVKNKSKIVNKIILITTITVLGCVMIIFSNLYFDLFNKDFFYNYNSFCKIAIYLLTTFFAFFIIFLYYNDKKLFYKILLLSYAVLSIFFVVIYFYKKTGLNVKFGSVQSFREYISEFGNLAPLLFTVLSFLQVVILPIPAFISVGAGTLLFGPFYGGLYSYIGIVFGSVTAYFIGKVFGKQVASWLVGKKNLEKGLTMIKGKDKVLLTFMFLFPFFPDDILCFVAGITTVSPLFFVIMILTTRAVSIFTSTYSMNNSLIPYNTWWGICIWAVIFAVTILLSVLIIKNSKKIEKFFKEKFSKKNE